MNKLYCVDVEYEIIGKQKQLFNKIIDVKAKKYLDDFCIITNLCDIEKDILDKLYKRWEDEINQTKNGKQISIHTWDNLFCDTHFNEINKIKQNKIK